MAEIITCFLCFSCDVNPKYAVVRDSKPQSIVVAKRVVGDLPQSVANTHDLAEFYPEFVLIWSDARYFQIRSNVVGMHWE